MSTCIIILYFLPFLIDQSLSESIIVKQPILILASATAIISFIFYIWTPKGSAFWQSLTVYILFAACAGSLIVTTGGIASPFIALWMLMSIFVGIFGLWGLIPLVAAIGSFIAREYLTGNLTPELLVATSFAGLLPIVASFIIWHNKAGKMEPEAGDKAYKVLASELSQVATQSEVVINAIGDGVIATDSKGSVQLINPAGQSLLGWSKPDTIGLNYKSILQLVDQQGAALDPAVDPVQQVLNNNQEARNDELTVMSKTGKKIMVSLVISPIGEMGSGAIIVFRDITKAKAEEREQAEFISTASHEMRTPVASIEGYLGLAMNPATAQIDEKARSFIIKAHESAQHLGHLFQDLLDISKVDDRRMTNTPKVVNLVNLTQDILQGLSQKAIDKGLTLDFKPNSDSGGKNIAPVYDVNLDNDHIREIIDNLVENAIKYTLKGGVTVDVTGNEDKVVVSVRDSGIGIPAEDIPHLFQKFYRVDNNETNQIGGTGLGLYLCRKLAESMQGRVWAESEYKKGSTFFLELPRISADEAARISEQQTIMSQTQANVQPVATVQATPTVIPVQSETMTNAVSIPSVKPATTVPRGQSLSREQIAAHVAKLQEMVKQQAITDASTTNKPPGEAS